jgi:hypothetical protein
VSWDIASKELCKVIVTSNAENALVTVKSNSDKLQCIGVGTDAAVFRHIDAPSYAFKVFSLDKLRKMKKEKEVYSKLGHSEYFPIYYGGGFNFLVISFEEGITLYDCLLKGIHIPKQVIQDVDNARKHAQDRGLNPRDIHIKNILLFNGKAKLLDVSEYMKHGNDNRWEYLKEGYKKYYHLIDGKAIPLWIIETVRKWYNQAEPDSFNLQDFMQQLALFFKIGV